MLQPEISHRCASCGASIREPAMFCPECGQPLSANASPNSEQPVAEPPTAETPAAAETPGPAVGSSTKAVEAGEAQPARPALEREDPKADPVDSESKADRTTRPGSRPGTRERTREKLQRASSAATSVARGALEDNVRRVEKIHHVSTAMLEEATYDPSLRFVLVALGLFIVFIVLLILSKVMG